MYLRNFHYHHFQMSFNLTNFLSHIFTSFNFETTKGIWNFSVKEGVKISAFHRTRQSPKWRLSHKSSGETGLRMEIHSFKQFLVCSSLLRNKYLYKYLLFWIWIGNWTNIITIKILRPNGLHYGYWIWRSRDRLPVEPIYEMNFSSLVLAWVFIFNKK